MKLLFAIPRLTYSGAPKMMAWVANKMAERGHDVHLVVFFSAEQAQMLNESITLHSLGVEQSGSRFVRNTAGMLKTIGRLHKTVKRIKPDIVISFLDSVGYVYLPIGSILTKSKFVVSERVDPYSYRGRKAKLRFRLMGFAHGAVFQTQGAQKFFEKFKKIYRKSTVIPNPVVVDEKILSMQQSVPSAEERDKIIVTAGRLSLAQKRQDVLLKAFKIFHESHPDYNLVIYGDGADQEKIRELVNQLGLSESVVMAGRVDNVECKMFRAAAFVLTSDFEGIPNALIEAMSVGVPSVSTDCSPGGAALLINDGENGFLVPVGDELALAEKLSLIVDNEDVSQTLSKNGLSITVRFSETVIADEWEAFLRRIINDEEMGKNAAK